MEEQVEIFKSNLIHDKEIKRILRIKNRSYDQLTIRKPLFEEYKNEGWSLNKENRETVIIRKQKSHDKEFEDRVWSMLARMDFDYLNGDTPLRLIYSHEKNIPGRKLDVFASDKETALIIECKSAKELRRRDLQTVINDLVTVKRGSNPFIQKLYQNEKRKVKYLLVTNNIILSDMDRERLKAEKIEHFNQDDINYYEQLTERLGEAAKYQLLGRLFKNEEIPQLENKVPAIKGMMGGYTYYSFSLEPEKLLKIGYILHRTETTNEDDGYQRMVSKSRLKEIEEFLNNENEPGFFPNSVIINISTKKEDPLVYTLLKGEEHNSEIAEPVILSLPKNYHSAFIIDGQHRLYGYANTQWKYKNSIPVVAFENLPPEKQVELFVQINSKQKPVSKNLLITIVADLMWNSDKPKDAITSLKSKLLQRLGEKDDSPLYKRIKIAENSKTDLTCITLDYILSNGLNKSNYFPKYQKGKVISLGHLWFDPAIEGYSKMLDKSYLFFRNIFNYIKENLEFQWNLGNNEGGLIATNIGALIVIRIVDDILEHLVSIERFTTINCAPIDIAIRTYPMLDIVIAFFATLDQQKIKQTKYLATSANGMENVIREFQKQINERFPAFNPLGLENWIVENSGTFNESSHEITEKLEHNIRTFVFDKLKEVYSDRWWLDGIPKEIQKNAAVTAIDKGNEEPAENFVYLLDYKKTIDKQWNIFKEFFTDPEVKSGKENQIKWFDQLNEIRNKVSHPGRAKVTASESDFLSKLKGWLLPKIAENSDEDV
jgi:DNA sulfur modification protein DndB